MTRRQLQPCGDCPFNTASPARVHWQAKADEGAWIPCHRSVTPAAASDVLQVRIAAWHREEECAGARLWRRDRQVPA